MASLLKLVATPLGNVNDISLRAIDAIKSADAIFAEDTRHSFKLIQALGITLKKNCRWISCDAHKEVKRIEVVVEKLNANENVLFLSDAGCPAISDPGSLLVQGVIQAGLSVEIIPGPSAHLAALMGAGVDTTRFAFLGFLPRKISHRKALIVAAANAGLALVCYESPLRLTKLLAELHEYLGERRVVVGRELTKVFETFHRGHLGAMLTPSFIEKGECVVVVEAGKLTAQIPIKDHQNELLDFIIEENADGKSAKDIARSAALSFGLKKKAAYDLVVKTVKSQN